MHLLAGPVEDAQGFAVADDGYRHRPISMLLIRRAREWSNRAVHLVDEVVNCAGGPRTTCVDLDTARHQNHPALSTPSACGGILAKSWWPGISRLTMPVVGNCRPVLESRCHTRPSPSVTVALRWLRHAHPPDGVYAERSFRLASSCRRRMADDGKVRRQATACHQRRVDRGFCVMGTKRSAARALPTTFGQATFNNPCILIPPPFCQTFC